MNNVSMSDVMICPECVKEDIDMAYDCYIYDTDEIEFCDDGTGHYRAYCRCARCKKDFVMWASFNYTVTNYSVHR